MILESQKYPLVSKQLLDATFMLSTLAQQLTAQTTPAMHAAVTEALTRQAANLKTALRHQNYANKMVAKEHEMQLAFARHPIQSVEDLKNAPLARKREILNSMAIVPVTLAASYLGVAKGDIYQLPNSGIPPWEKYLGVQAMSINQIRLLEKAPDFCYRHHVEIEPQGCVETLLDHLIMVNEETAQAFINTSHEELLTLTNRTYLYRPRFRLADLEKIRVAKLNAGN